MLLVTTRPHTDPIKKLNDANEWDSPYSWPVRREFSRILHKPRPHFGIIYTERFLNSRPLTYFDDETKLIRAKAGAILKAVHTPIPKPSKVLRPYETLDSYRSHQLIPYGVPQHLYVQSHFNEPAHLTIGRGHLACIQYAGGKGYPRRKNLYSDENRNIRDEIKFRSYYNRPKHEDPNTLPTGFAWRLLHLPPKDDKPFKLYKQSRTLPLPESSKHEVKTSSNEDKESRPVKRIHKTYTQPLDESSNVFSSSKKSLSDHSIETYTPKVKDEIKKHSSEVEQHSPVVEECSPVVEDIEEECKKPRNAIQKLATEESQTTDDKARVEEKPKPIDKKSKKNKDDESVAENAHKRRISYPKKSISEEIPDEKQENNETVPTSNKDITEVEAAPEISENTTTSNKDITEVEAAPEISENTTTSNKDITEVEAAPEISENTNQEIKSETNQEMPEAEVVTENTKLNSVADICQTDDSKNKTIEDKTTEDVQLEETNDPNSIQEVQEEVLEPVLEHQLPAETMQEVNEGMPVSTANKSDIADSLEIDDTAVVDDSNVPDITEVKQEESSSNTICDDSKISEGITEITPSDHQVKTDSETVQDDDNTKQDETEHVQCNGTEIDSDLQIRDDSGESLITELQLETQVVDQITEISSAQITHSSEETVMQVYSSTQISQVAEDSDKPEDLVNETDITTDEENVEISME